MNSDSESTLLSMSSTQSYLYCIPASSNEYPLNPFDFDIITIALMSDDRGLKLVHGFERDIALLAVFPKRTSECLIWQIWYQFIKFSVREMYRSRRNRVKFITQPDYTYDQSMDRIGNRIYPDPYNRFTMPLVIKIIYYHPQNSLSELVSYDEEYGHAMWTRKSTYQCCEHGLITPVFWDTQTSGFCVSCGSYGPQPASMRVVPRCTYNCNFMCQMVWDVRIGCVMRKQKLLDLLSRVCLLALEVTGYDNKELNLLLSVLFRVKYWSKMSNISIFNVFESLLFFT